MDIDHHEINNSVPKVSYSDKVSGSSSWSAEADKIRNNSMEWNVLEDCPPNSPFTVNFDSLVLDRLRTPWKLSLMGKCMGIDIRPAFMEQRVRLMWKPIGGLECIDLGKGTFLFRFSLQEDYDKALFGGPWFILNHCLMLNK